MPRALVATAPRTPALVEYREPEIGPGQVRLRSVMSVVKHGTELRGFLSGNHLFRAIGAAEGPAGHLQRR